MRFPLLVMTSRFWAMPKRMTFLHMSTTSSHTQPVLVRETREESHFATQITFGGQHALISDLKPIENGKNGGPSPKELLCASLGSCTTMTIRTFFENSKAISNSTWANATLSSVSVLVTEVKGDHPHVPQGLNIVITLLGDLTSVQQQRLLRAATNCPVKMMLSKELKITSVLTT